MLESNGEFVPIQKVHVEDGQGLIIVTEFLLTRLSISSSLKQISVHL